MTSTVSTKPTSFAWAMFNDQSFSFETLRALAYTSYGGADIGEVTSTASRIPDGDKTAWYSEWRALAERIHADADRSAAEGHPVSARESYLRASNYYRLCAFYLRVDSSNDPEVREAGQLSVDRFAHATQLMNPAPQPVRFPYGDATLPGWWIFLLQADAPRQPENRVLCSADRGSLGSARRSIRAGRRGDRSALSHIAGPRGHSRKKVQHLRRPEWTLDSSLQQ